MSGVETFLPFALAEAATVIITPDVHRFLDGIACSEAARLSPHPNRWLEHQLRTPDTQLVLPSGSATKVQYHDPERGMKMGELEQRTGVNRETIRVLIRKGLVSPPEKPKATVAHYSEEHVQAIRAIRSLQHEHQVTLDQIGSMLRGDHLEKRVEAPAFQHLERLVAARFGEDKRRIPLTTLLQTNPNADRDARGLAALGALDLEETDHGTAVSYTDASLISIWGRMRDYGFDESASFYPEVLDHYTRAANYLAYAEATRFLARVEGAVDEDKAADMLKAGLPLMLDFFGVLRMKFFLRYIAAGTDGLSDMEPPQLALGSGPDRPRKPAAGKGRRDRRSGRR